MPQTPDQNGIDPKDVLLPQKEERTSASAERVNAGVLLEGEQGATLPTLEAAPIAPPQKPQGPLDVPIAPLQTYEKDVQSVISQKNISGIDIVTAESERASKGGFSLDTKKPIDPAQIKGALAIVASVGFVLLAASLLYFVFLRPAPVPFALAPSNTPFIAVDDTQVLLLSPDQAKRSILMQNLMDIKNKTSISLGLISRTYVALSTWTAAGTLPPALPVQTLLSVLAPNTSADFLRSLDPSYYILGEHVFDGTQPFLLLRVESYERAFSGMLAWERTMSSELSPLFTRTVRPKLGGSATSTTPESGAPTQFQDKIVENHDTRVILNADGDILLLWAFLDRDTLVITTNDATLRELISRRSSFTSQR